MEKFIINGGKNLVGSVCVPRSKNSILPILASCVLCREEVTLHDCPHFLDIDNMLKLLSILGAKIEKKHKNIHIDCKNISNCTLPDDLSKQIRSSIFLLGPLITRFGCAKVSYPGGCEIGSRPIDLHLKGLKALGAKIDEKYGKIDCCAHKLVGADIHLDYPSVGATENIMMAGVLSAGTTRIFNSAKEPEIVDLQNFINSMGGKIMGAGTDTIVIEGVKKLHSTEYTPIPDRIIAGTYLLAGAMCGGDILIKNVDYAHIYSLLTKFKDAGFDLSIKDDNIRLRAGKEKKSFGKIDTMPYPGFPTDLQAQTLALQCVSDGVCVVTENLFETRFKHVPELIKMGANIITKDRTAIVTGVTDLYGAEVTATDLRAGSALVMAGMYAHGQTIISNIHNIDRGYESIEKVFNLLGADIKRI